MGLGLIAFLALMLAAQAALILWMTDRIAGAMPASSPQRLAQLVASDISTSLTEEADLDLDEYVRNQYGNVFQAILVVMRDGRMMANHDDVPQELRDAVRAAAERRTLFPPGGRFFPRGPRGLTQGDGTLERGGSPGPFLGRGGPGRGAEFAAAPIVVDGDLVGRVAVLPGGPPFSRVARRLGPTLGLVGGSVLAVGAALIAFVVFGPVRRRLRQVQDATERLGSGDLSARAPEQGGDEVAAVARSFNRMADELATRARALEAADKARRQLLADVSHELMTPLTAMRGYVETLTMSEVTLDPATRQRYLGIITDETHRLERIVGDLLDLARLEGGGAAMRQDAVDVETLFARVAERHERELTDRGITLERRVAANAARLVGDRDRLEQALQNLMANALRHTPDSGRIALAADAVEAGLRITVRDSGPGIPPEHLPSIFERFYKADAARASTGSGLGLSIVKTIVERHGGTITARNDQGAVFEITLPAPRRT
ncbi:MAG: HAMP domain-containing histidine kinase [Acidobacteria bacterium]|nr:HAMP domain-containing histidine kinase [Acidobacteriota bacterium]